ncbi:hypothetical protein [Candidatus Rhabdochlamydia sp. T3358]|uniref:hypothetical protein n=1 Tax=Candidatus Rhabdochlamydia sp. T3358 TaxID=2099795 RepID=UPI0010AFB831|nr:hypothetical protein [Candidatus Rhabdochlamydia sp. T3358]VHO03341.1 hypothetical protein RHT_00859 [Candidatus Rhabdochlamydia sp. T3358]
MSQSIKSFLKPTYYISEEDNQLKASVQMISEHKQKGGLNGHARAVAQAVHSIVLVIFINIPYHFALGSKNLFLNCVHLNLELMVLEHYNAAMQNLIYSVIATIYVTLGTFIPPVLNGFKMERSQPDDLSIPLDSSLDIAIEDQSEIRSPTPSLEEMDLTSILSTQSEPSTVVGNQDELRMEFSEMLTNSNVFSSDFTPGMPSVEDQEESKESETRGSIPFNTPSVQNEIRNEHDFVSSQRYPNQANSMPTSSINTNDDLVSDGWLMTPNVKSFATKSINIGTRDMIGAYGVNLERQAYRTALDEYIRILKDDFDIDLNERLTTIEKWLRSPAYQNNPIVNALYRTLFYLTKPVAYDDKGPIYTHAKEQYEKYVTSLRELLLMVKSQEALKVSRGSNIKEIKKCFTLTYALCKARFRSENHGLLRNLLQLHEYEYDRLHPEEKIPVVTRENFTQVVMAKNKKVTGAPASMKVSSTQRSCRMAYGAVGIEDFLMTDIPFLRGKQVFKNDKKEERSFYYMRHPTPHVEGSLTRITLGAMSRITGLGHIESGEAIAPEFEGMLEAIAQRNESYLIQSHQRLNDLGKVENEDSRSQTLYRLQESHKNFHVVFQAVEGELFDRKGSYEKMETFADLKEAIKASFYIEGSPNRLPALLEKDEDYCNFTIDQLLAQVHQTLFGERSGISFGGQDPTVILQPFFRHLEHKFFYLHSYRLRELCRARLRYLH